ncbi:tetratricopeptide repeat-containing sensor histidine kinase [Pedobacter insulae]|uniref:histidine kinase n=1 Tax=Pedobacter insulae TaxID=414048 RepID=A0A1I2VIW5_9SPHI|nr:HAMP domain-containing sensor histidine kinase [Pedobacter insulae]SFG89053.1 Tetratricopeptide repeat-containing protein [Pedobacter insulae]
MYARRNLILFFSLLTFLNLLGALSYAQSNKSKPQTSADYIDIVKHYRYLNPDSALYFVKEGIAKAKHDKDSVSLAALINQHGMIDDNAARYKDAYHKYLQAETLYRKLNDKIGLASTLVRLGVVEQRKGNYAKSLGYFFNALKISENSNDKLGMLEARVCLSESYLNIGEYDNAIGQLRTAQAINAQIPLSNFTLNMYISFGNVYIKLKQYDQAITYINEGLSKSNKVAYNGLKISLLIKLAQAYHEKGSDMEAIKILKEALAFSKEIKNVLRQLTCFLDLAKIYVEQKSLTQALTYYKEALAITETYKLYRQQIDILNNMSVLYKTTGNLTQALRLKERSYELADEFYYKDMLKQITSLETAYDREKSNARLRELELINSKEKSFNSVILSIAIGTLIVLLVTFAFYYRSTFLNSLLKRTNQQLAESNALKDRFFSIVAHDIRSPLVSTISILKLIHNNELDDELRSEMVQKLALHCENSLEILDKLLKWGQMQIKGVRLNTSEFSPISNIDKNVALFQEAAEKKMMTITINVPQNIMLQADADHFDFVIRNLIANAIKFTQTGGEIELRAQPVVNNMIRFEVKDNGVGISKARIDKLFELSAVGTKGTSSEEGTSLGLMICKEFILANKGEITVESEVGKGTVFTFTLKGFLKNLA